MNRKNKMNKRRILLVTIIILLSSLVAVFGFVQQSEKKSFLDASSVQQARKHYTEKRYPTPNFNKEAVNEVKGVILHHTAEPTIERSLAILSSPEKGVSTHVVIDTDGTRYVMADPTVVTYHAGLSILNGRENCNYFTIGIEFQGNTLEAPLTNDQINSGIEYLQPLLKKYDIPLNSIVTHEMVRKAYKRRYPNKRCFDKVDITQKEYFRFMKALRQIVAY